MASTLLPDLLRDDTGYDATGNEQVEVGWREVLSGLNKVIVGNVLSIAGFAFLAWFMIGVIDMSRHVKHVGKVNWDSIFALIGLIIFSGIQICALGLMLKGQWLCLHAPERRHAKQYMFGCMLCIVAMPLLNVGAAVIGGIDNLLTVSKDKASVSEYMQMVGGILGLFSSVLFVLFLRAVADCFENKTSSMLASVYVAFTIGLTVVSVLIVLVHANALTEYKELATSMKRSATEILVKGGLLVLIGLGWLASYVWYLVLLVNTRGTVARALRQKTRSLAAT